MALLSFIGCMVFIDKAHYPIISLILSVIGMKIVERKIIDEEN